MLSTNKRTVKARVTAAEKRLWVAEMKIALGCADCGYNAHAEALDFDHVRGTKEFDIGGVGVVSRGKARILLEIEKCDVVCANCHRVRTADRRRKELGLDAPQQEAS